MALDFDYSDYESGPTKPPENTMQVVTIVETKIGVSANGYQWIEMIGYFVDFDLKFYAPNLFFPSPSGSPEQKRFAIKKLIDSLQAFGIDAKNLNFREMTEQQVADLFVGRFAQAKVKNEVSNSGKEYAKPHFYEALTSDQAEEWSSKTYTPPKPKSSGGFGANGTSFSQASQPQSSGGFSRKPGGFRGGGGFGGGSGFGS